MKLTKERVAGMRAALSAHYNREFKGRESQVLETLVWNQIQILDHMTDAMLEAEAPKPERCGGKPGEPKWWHPVGMSDVHRGWHEARTACPLSGDIGWKQVGGIVCTKCPGCSDCAPVVDWATAAAEEWCAPAHASFKAIPMLAAIIRKHAPKGT